ncbi:helix-turn-helix domain-containing protein, partial [Neisseria weixii]
MNCTPKVGHHPQLIEVQFFMAKYSNGFKLQVVNYYLQGHGGKHTAKVFCLGHAAVRKRATRYVLHGGDGINRW